MLPLCGGGASVKRGPALPPGFFSPAGKFCPGSNGSGTSATAPAGGARPLGPLPPPASAGPGGAGCGR